MDARNGKGNEIDPKKRKNVRQTLRAVSTLPDCFEGNLMRLCISFVFLLFSYNKSSYLRFQNRIVALLGNDFGE